MPRKNTTLSFATRIAGFTFVLCGLQTALAQTSFAPVRVEVFNGAPLFYTAPWTPNMTVLNAMEQSLPTTSPSGSISLSYFPQFAGYMLTAVGGVPAPNVKKYWSTCLLPAGSGSTVISLPLAINRITVGPGDLVILAYDTADCTKVPTK